MENSNDIDDLFKDIIDPYEMTHSDKVWESLDHQLEKKSHSRDKAIIFRLRIALCALFFLFGIITTYYFINTSEIKNNYLSTIQEKTDNIDYSAYQSTAYTNKISENEKSKRISKNRRNESSAENSTKNKNKINVSFANAASVETEESRSKIKEPATSNNLTERQKVHGQTLLDTSSAFPVISERKNEAAKIDSISKELVKETRTAIDTADTNRVIAVNLSTKDTSNKMPSYTAVLSKGKMDSILKVKAANRFSLSAYFSPDLTRKYLIDNDNTDNQDEGDYNNNEVPDFSYNAGLMAGYDLTKNWGLKFGGTYANLSQTIKPKTVYAKIGTDGQAHYQFNTTYSTAELSNEQRPAPALNDSININSNSMQLLQIIGIPVIVKYQISRNKFNYYAQAGLSLNFLIGEKLIVENQNKQEIIRNTEGLNNYYAGGILGFGVSYNPVKRLAILIEPTVRGAITPVNKSTPVSTRPISYGISIGLGWHF